MAGSRAKSAAQKASTRRTQRRVDAHGDRHARWMSSALLVISGAAALIYQVLWIKQLSLVVGIEVQAITAGLSAFFIGLAIGNIVGGRVADRIPRSWRLYAVLEAGTAVLAVATTYALPHSALMFAVLQRHIDVVAWVVPCALVGLPACLMGATLPVMLRARWNGTPALGRSGGALYAANTLGALFGTLLSGFVMIALFGVLHSAYLAALLNVLAAVAAWGIDLSKARLCGRAEASSYPFSNNPPSKNPQSSRPASSSATSGSATASSPSSSNPTSSHTRNTSIVAVALYAVAGGVAMGYEVVWSQIMAPLISTRTFAFTVTLATYLAATALGSAISQRHVARVHAPWTVFGLLIALAGAVSTASLAMLGPLVIDAQTAVRAWAFDSTHSMLVAMCAGFAVASLWTVFVPALLLGAAMPFAMQLGSDRIGPGRTVGRVVGANTAGGVVGLCVTGFVLIPAVGVVRSLSALALTAALVGIASVWVGRAVTNQHAPSSRSGTPQSDTPQGGDAQSSNAQASTGSRSTHGRTHIIALSSVGWVALLTLGLAIATPADRLARVLVDVRGGTLVAYEESAGGAVAVVEQHTTAQRFRRLYIQGVSNSGDAMTSLRYMRLQTLLPLIIHTGEAHSALVIGAGTGITAGATLVWPTLDKRVVAELLPAVIRNVPAFAGNHDVSRDARVDIRLRDGRRELLSRDEQYDVITLEPPPPSAAGVVNLYSTDFYRIAASRLERHGLVAQWLPISTQNEADTQSLIASFVAAFPYATLWTTELHEMMLVGSMEPIALDWATITRRMAEPNVASALREIGIASPQTLLATWVTDRAGLAYYAADAAPVTDDAPRIEYASWVRGDAFVPTLSHLLALRAEPPLSNTGHASVDAVNGETTTLHTFYRAALDAYRGDRDAWAADMAEVMRADGANPYYRWFAPNP